MLFSLFILVKKKQFKRYDLWEKARNTSRLLLMEPLGYHDSVGFVDNCKFILTDSGGSQEETTFLDIPCLTLRPNTERPISISQGPNKLTSLETLDKDIEYVLNGYSPRGETSEFLDGKTGERVVKILLQ